jgi:hypothetical protein
MPRVINLTVGNGPRKGTLIDRSELPFKVPDFTAFYKQAGERILGPHIMATSKISVDNKNGITDPTEYITRNFMPRGAVEVATDHRVYGGLYRNRPMKRAPWTTSGSVGSPTSFTWKDKAFVLQSIIDAYWTCAFVDILDSATIPHALEWASVAVSLGWSNRFIWMPDGSTSVARNGPTNLKNYSVQAFSHATGGPAWMKIGGKYVVIPFGPELVMGDPASTTAIVTVDMVVNYWVDYCTQMDAAGYPVVLGAVFTRAWRDNNQKTAIVFNDPRLAKWVRWLGRWGVRDPQGLASAGADAYGAAEYSRAAPPNGFGKEYVDTIAIEDTRPRSAKYYEPVGWKLILDFYARIRATKPEAVELATVNDMQENSGIEPSSLWGFSAADVCTYDNIWHITGSPPEITKDALYLAYRIMNIPGLGVQPTLDALNDTHTVTNADGSTSTVKNYTKRMTNGGGSAGVNSIDILYYATAAAEVRLSINGVAQTPKPITAGRNRVQFSMANGAITAGMYRNNILVPGTLVQSLPGQDINMNVAKDGVEDYTYRRVASLRGAYAV